MDQKLVDKRKILNDIERDEAVFQNIDEVLKNDKDFMLEAIQINPYVFNFINDKFKNDEEFMLLAIENNSETIEYASDELKNDKEFLLQAIEKEPSCMRSVSDELKNDKDFLMKVAEKNIYLLSYASDELMRDKDFILQAIEKESIYIEDYSILQYVSDELKNDEDFMLKAIEKKRRYGMNYASDRLKNEKKFVLQALEITSLCFEYVSNELKNDKEIVLKAVKGSSECIKYVSDELKNNKEFMRQFNNNIIVNDTILEYKNVYKEDLLNMDKSYGLLACLEYFNISLLDKNKFGIEIIIRGKLSKEICKRLDVEDNSEGHNNNEKDYVSVFESKHTSIEQIKNIFNVLDSSNKDYHIKSLKLHIGFATYNSLKSLNGYMARMNQEYNISQIDNNKTIIEYTSKDREKEIKEKPLVIYIDENIKNMNDKIIIKIEHIDKPHIMLYLSNIINTLNANNNIEHIDFIAITPDRGTFYDVWDFLMENNIKYIYQNKINISGISSNILNQIETFLNGFKAKYSIRKILDEVILNMYPRSREERDFVYDVLELNNILYTDDYMPSDIDASGESLWMFSTSKEEKEKISEILKKPDQNKIDRLEELGAPEIIIESEKKPLECNYGIITLEKSQKQIENILQSLKLNYYIIDSNSEIIKKYEAPDSIN